MKLKSAFALILLLFVAASVVYVIVDGFHIQIEDADKEIETAVPIGSAWVSDSDGDTERSEHRVVVYYFHGTYRCRMCRDIEQYAYEALETGFPEELQSGTGKIEWRAVNVEEPEHQHFIDDYQLRTKSLILADVDGETQVRWKNLDRIWALAGYKSEFISYVQEEIRAYLEVD